VSAGRRVLEVQPADRLATEDEPAAPVDGHLHANNAGLVHAPPVEQAAVAGHRGDSPVGGTIEGVDPPVIGAGEPVPREGQELNTLGSARLLGEKLVAVPADHDHVVVVEDVPPDVGIEVNLENRGGGVPDGAPRVQGAQRRLEAGTELRRSLGVPCGAARRDGLLEGRREPLAGLRHLLLVRLDSLVDGRRLRGLGRRERQHEQESDESAHAHSS
jgi:hypothetical protein